VTGIFFSVVVVVFLSFSYEGLPGVLGNKGTLAKCRREQGNISHFLGTGEQNSKNYEGEQITKMCGNMGT